MSSSLQATLLAIVLAMLLPSDVEASVADRFVHRRKGLAPWSVERVVATRDKLVVTISDRGLQREERIAWDQIASVDPDAEGRLEVGVESGLAIGDRIWRGLRRLQRGDARLARQAFEAAWELGPKVDVEDGELAIVTMEGLVRCGIELADTDDVLAEALIFGELCLAGRRTDRFSGVNFAAAIVDDSTGLVPDIPPVADAVDLVTLRRDFREFPRLSETSDLRRDLWVRLLERSGPPEMSDRGLDDGTRLLLDLNRLDSSDPREREAARRRLLDRLDEQPAWRIAWVRWFAGSSAIARANGDPDATLAGVLDLIHVLALEDAAPASIRQAALSLGIAALARTGRDDDAAVLRAILTFEHPDRIGTEPRS